MPYNNSPTPITKSKASITSCIMKKFQSFNVDPNLFQTTIATKAAAAKELPSISMIMSGIFSRDTQNDTSAKNSITPCITKNVRINTAIV